MDAREVKIKRSIVKMSTAQMEYALHTFEESHEQNLEYITSLREKINRLEAQVEETEDDLEEVQGDNEDSPPFQTDNSEGVELNIAGIKQKCE